MDPDQRPLSAFLTDQTWERMKQKLALSARELQIARLVFEDKKEEFIAVQIGISPHTVHTHMARLHNKLRVGSRVELVTRIFATFLQLIEEPGSGLPPLCAHKKEQCCPFER